MVNLFEQSEIQIKDESDGNWNLKFIFYKFNSYKSEIQIKDFKLCILRMH